MLEEQSELSCEQINQYLLRLVSVSASIGKLEALSIYVSEKYKDDNVIQNILGEIINELSTMSETRYRTSQLQRLNEQVTSPMQQKGKLSPESAQKLKALKDARLNKAVPLAPEPKVYERQVDFNQPRIGFDFKESSNIKHVDYFPYTQNMNVTFVQTVKDENKNEVLGPDNSPIHRIYSYSDVSQEEILEAINDEEPSKAFNKMKNAHRYEETTASVGLLNS